MEVYDAEIDWDKEFGNNPKLINYIDDLPSRTEIEFEGSTETGLWYGEHESGYVSFFAWDGGQQRGFGGQHYDIETVDGEEVTLKGPWSSRAGVMNKAGFGPVMSVLYRDHPDQLGGRSGAMTVEKAETVIDEHIDYRVELEEQLRFDANEPYYVPTKIGDQQ